MVIRVWIDNGTAAELRARITRSIDLRTGEISSASAGSVGEITAAVHAWLDAFMANVGATPHDADGAPPP